MELVRTSHIPNQKHSAKVRRLRRALWLGALLRASIHKAKASQSLVKAKVEKVNWHLLIQHRARFKLKKR